MKAGYLKETVECGTLMVGAHLAQNVLAKCGHPMRLAGSHQIAEFVCSPEIIGIVIYSVLLGEMPDCTFHKGWNRRSVIWNFIDRMLLFLNYCHSIAPTSPS